MNTCEAVQRKNNKNSFVFEKGLFWALCLSYPHDLTQIFASIAGTFCDGPLVGVDIPYRVALCGMEVNTELRAGSFAKLFARCAQYVDTESETKNNTGSTVCFDWQNAEMSKGYRYLRTTHAVPYWAYKMTAWLCANVAHCDDIPTYCKIHQRAPHVAHAHGILGYVHQKNLLPRVICMEDVLTPSQIELGIVTDRGEYHKHFSFDL